MMNKRYLAPVIAGVVVFGAVTAFAAGFTVTSNTVVSGNASVTGCNAVAKVSYTTVWGETHRRAARRRTSSTPRRSPRRRPARAWPYHVTLQDVDEYLSRGGFGHPGRDDRSRGSRLLAAEDSGVRRRWNRDHRHRVSSAATPPNGQDPTTPVVGFWLIRAFALIKTLTSCAASPNNRLFAATEDNHDR